MYTTVTLAQISKKLILETNKKLSKLGLTSPQMQIAFLSLASKFFIDVFTFTSAQHSPEDMQELLAKLLETMQEEIFSTHTNFQSFLEDKGILKTGESEVTVEV